MMYKISLGLAACLTAAGITLRSLSQANAQALGPVVSLGENPWVSASAFIGLEPGASEAIYTVPDDQMLILTGLLTNHRAVDLYEGATERMDGTTESAVQGFLSQGNAHLTFPGGAEVRLHNPAPHSTEVSYFLNGYLAHP
jgi:hypothetical protein